MNTTILDTIDTLTKATETINQQLADLRKTVASLNTSTEPAAKKQKTSSSFKVKPEAFEKMLAILNAHRSDVLVLCMNREDVPGILRYTEKEGDTPTFQAHEYLYFFDPRIMECAAFIENYGHYVVSIWVQSERQENKWRILYHYEQFLLLHTSLKFVFSASEIKESEAFRAQVMETIELMKLYDANKPHVVCFRNFQQIKGLLTHADAEDFTVQEETGSTQKVKWSECCLFVVVPSEAIFEAFIGMTVDISVSHENISDILKDIVILKVQSQRIFYRYANSTTDTNDVELNIFCDKVRSVDVKSSIQNEDQNEVTEMSKKLNEITGKLVLIKYKGHTRVCPDICLVVEATKDAITVCSENDMFNHKIEWKFIEHVELYKQSQDKSLSQTVPEDMKLKILNYFKAETGEYYKLRVSYSPMKCLELLQLWIAAVCNYDLFALCDPFTNLTGVGQVECLMILKELTYVLTQKYKPKDGKEAARIGPEFKSLFTHHLDTVLLKLTKYGHSKVLNTLVLEPILGAISDAGWIVKICMCYPKFFKFDQSHVEMYSNLEVSYRDTVSLLKRVVNPSFEVFKDYIFPDVCRISSDLRWSAADEIWFRLCLKRGVQFGDVPTQLFCAHVFMKISFSFFIKCIALGLQYKEKDTCAYVLKHQTA
jgi:hypothetical protein